VIVGSGSVVAVVPIVSAGASSGSVVAGDAVVAAGCVDADDDESSSLEHAAATSATTTHNATAAVRELTRRLLIFAPPIGDRSTVATTGPFDRIDDDQPGEPQQGMTIRRNRFRIARVPDVRSVSSQSRIGRPDSVGSCLIPLANTTLRRRSRHQHHRHEKDRPLA
jgi:hypothetical protein